MYMPRVSLAQAMYTCSNATPESCLPGQLPSFQPALASNRKASTSSFVQFHSMRCQVHAQDSDEGYPGCGQRTRHFYLFLRRHCRLERTNSKRKNRRGLIRLHNSHAAPKLQDFLLAQVLSKIASISISAERGFGGVHGV